MASRYEYNGSKVNETILKLKKAQSLVDTGFTSQINSAIGKINGARGVGDLDIDLSGVPTFATELSDSLVSMTTMLSEKAKMIEDYNNASWLKKGWNSLLMFVTKLGEGFLTGLENIGDGVLSLGGKLCSALKMEKASNWLFETAGKDVVGGAFYESYEDGILSNINQYSLFSHTSKGASIIRSIGVAGTYLGAGWLAGGTTLAYTGVAALGGLGSGTQLGLMSGQSNKEAFKTGLLSSARDAAAMFLGTKITGYAINSFLAKGAATSTTSFSTAAAAESAGIVANGGTIILPEAMPIAADQALTVAGEQALTVGGANAAGAAGATAVKVMGPLQGLVGVPIAKDEIAKEAVRSANHNLGATTVPNDLNFDASKLDTSTNSQTVSIDTDLENEVINGVTNNTSTATTNNSGGGGYYGGYSGYSGGGSSSNPTIISTSETPTSQTPTSETPTSQTPTSETPTSQTPTSETPTSQTPTSETPTSQTPTSETPTSQTPTSETPTSHIPTGYTPTGHTKQTDESENDEDEELDEESMYRTDFILDPKSRDDVPWDEIIDVSECPVVEPNSEPEPEPYIPPVYDEPIVEQPVVTKNNSNDTLKVVGGIAAAAGVVAAGVAAKKMIDKKEDESYKDEQYDDGYYAPVSSDNSDNVKNDVENDDSEEDFYVKY